MSALAKFSPPPVRFTDVAVPIPAGFALESGDTLADTHIQLRRFGNMHGPQIVALGGISSGRDVCSDSGWWRDTIIDKVAIDLDHYGVIGFDFSPGVDQRVRITPLDQARLVAIGLDAIGVTRLHAFVGASFGGLVGLAFAAEAPERVSRLCVISAAHRQAAQSLALRGVQRRIVEFGLHHDDATVGLALARQLGMITYRTKDEFEARFGAGVDADGRGEVDRYLESRGQAYPQHMPPRRWLSLSEAIDRFSVDPAAIVARTTLVACVDDSLVPATIIRELAGVLPNLRRLDVFRSLYGHDAFLKEPRRVAACIRECLEEPIDG